MSDNIKKDRVLVDPFIPNKPETPRKESPMVFDVPTKSTEDKKYIIFIVEGSSDGLYDGLFKICNSRTECYRHIKTLIETFGEDFNVYESKVITETKQIEAESGDSKYYMINYDDALTVYAFCKAVEMYYKGTVVDFDIDDYYAPPQQNEAPINNIDEAAFTYAMGIDDPIIAQAAMDTFKEVAQSKNKKNNYNLFDIQNGESSQNI